MSRGLLGEDDPTTLVNTLVYLFASTFRFEVHGEEHRELRFSQLKLLEET